MIRRKTGTENVSAPTAAGAGWRASPWPSLLLLSICCLSQASSPRGRRALREDPPTRGTRHPSRSNMQGADALHRFAKRQEVRASLIFVRSIDVLSPN